MNKRTCRRCGIERDIEEFYRYGKNNARRHVCIPCKKAEHKAAHQARGSARRNKLGVSEAKYQHNYKKRGGKCDICRLVYPFLCIDHDHRTGKVRGMLCKSCNAGLGQFQDNVVVMRRAVKYLEFHGE